MDSRWIVAALLFPALAGCLSDGPDASAPPTGVAASAEEAGARGGPAPAAAKGAFSVEAAGKREVAYPVPLATNPARDPVTIDLSDAFATADCQSYADVEGVARPVRFTDLSDTILVGDAYGYEIRFAFENTDVSWGEIHMGFVFGSRREFDTAPTNDRRGVTEFVYTGQSYRAAEDDPVALAVVCWYGAVTSPIPYSLTVSVTFGEGAVPAEAPFLVRVPENATKLHAIGVPVDPARGVLSHYRVFGPDDKLVCECALSSRDRTSTLDLPGPGDYVVLVDHTDNGFVSFALDAPSPSPLLPLASAWNVYPLLETDGAVGYAASASLDLPRVPLVLVAWTRPAPEDHVAAGRKVDIRIANARGEVASFAQAGYAMVNAPAFGSAFLPFAPDGWEQRVDHHLYAPGAHEVSVRADAFRGEVFVVTREYMRPT